MLTDVKIRKTKPSAKSKKLSDRQNGLYLIVLPSGGRSFRIDYQFAGKRKTMTLGLYPEVSLSDARSMAVEARRNLTQGLDPSVERKIRKVEAQLQQGGSFESVAREWANMTLTGKSQSHRDRSMAALENDLFPVLGEIPIRELSPVLLLSALRRIESRSADMAHRAKTLVGQILRYAVATSRAERDFTPDLRGALRSHHPSHYAAITDPSEFARMMLAIDRYDGTMTVRNALRMAPLLMLRPGELSKLEWEHVNWDRNQLELPVGYMKNKDRAHIVPLCDQALQILREQQRYCGKFEPVFPSPHSRKRHMGATALQKALKKLGYGENSHTPHGFRASARTIMEEELQVPPHLLEHQLHHLVRDTHRRAYNRTMHLEARREMLQRWADWIDEQKSALANSSSVRSNTGPILSLESGPKSDSESETQQMEMIF